MFINIIVVRQRKSKRLQIFQQFIPLFSSPALLLLLPLVQLLKILATARCRGVPPQLHQGYDARLGATHQLRQRRRVQKRPQDPVRRKAVGMQREQGDLCGGSGGGGVVEAAFGLDGAVQRQVAVRDIVSVK